MFGLIFCMYDCICEFFAKRRQRKASELCKDALKGEHEPHFDSWSCRTFREPSFSDELRALIRVELEAIEKEKQAAHASAHDAAMYGLARSINEDLHYVPKKRRKRK